MPVNTHLFHDNHIFRARLVSLGWTHCISGVARGFDIFQAAATEGTAFSVPVVQAVAAVAIFFFINVTDDEPPFRQTQIFNK